MTGKEASALWQGVRKGAAIISVFCALLLFLDYILPGAVVQHKVAELNAFQANAKSRSLSYRLVSGDYTFPVAEEFTANVTIGDTVRLEISVFLKIVNAYRLQTQKEYQTYYTRYLSGLFFPLVLLLVSLISLRLRNPANHICNLFLALHGFTLFFTFMIIYTDANLF